MNIDNKYYKHDISEKLQLLIKNAIDKNVTDIHIDPIRGEYNIRFRIDGLVQVYKTVELEEGDKILNQIRTASDITIEHKFKPVEGHFIWNFEGYKEKDIRATFIPSNLSEAVHIRILTPPDKLNNIEKLGMTEADINKINDTLSKPEGLILISGPTGAGKTTTAYSMVNMLDLDRIISVSIEDPIEFYIPGIRQVQVNEEHGLTMVTGLRSLLRMDPDLILVGEIRDSDSANTAVRAASAGRFVLATIHARDTAAAVDSLHNLSVPLNALGSSLRLLISQNLLRRVCVECSEERKLNDSEIELFKKNNVEVPDKVKIAKNCEKCIDGYIGQVGIFEVVEVYAELSDKIMKGIDQYSLRKIIRANETKTLIGDALLKVVNGITTMEEIYHIYWPGGVNTESIDKFKTWSISK